MMLMKQANLPFFPKKKYEPLTSSESMRVLINFFFYVAFLKGKRINFFLISFENGLNIFNNFFCEKNGRRFFET